MRLNYCLVFVGSLFFACAHAQDANPSKVVKAELPVLIENAPDNTAGFEVFSNKMAAMPEEAKPYQILFLKGEWSRRHQNIKLPIIWGGKDADGQKTYIAYTKALEGAIRIVPPQKPDTFNIDFDVEEYDYVLEEIDPEKSLADLFTLLSSSEEDENRWERERMMSQTGELMLIAVRLHKAGYTDPANQLATFLFTKFSKREVLILGLSALADEAYVDLLSDFTTQKDSQAFVNGAEALLQEHQAYWVVGPILAEKLPSWKQSLGQATDTLPEMEAGFLDEEQLALYRFLLEKPEVLQVVAEIFGSANWMLMPDSLLLEYYDYYLQPESESEEEKARIADLQQVLDYIKKSKPGFLKIVQVMLSDQRLIPAVDEYGSTSVEYRGHGQPPSLPEPMKLNRFAIRLVEGIAPENGDWDEDPVLVEGMLQDYRQSTQNLTRQELALFYLQSQNGDYIADEIIYTLLASEKIEQRKQIIDRMLAWEDNLNNAINIMMDFASYKPEEAKPALEQMLGRLKLVDPDEAWEFGGKEGIKRTITSVEKLLGLAPETEVGDLSFEQKLDLWIEKPNHTAMQTAMAAGKEMSDLGIQQIIAARVQQHSPTVSSRLIQLQSTILSSGGVRNIQDMMYSPHREQMKYYLQPEEGSGEEPESASTEMTPLEEAPWEKEIWLPILEAEETFTEQKIAFFAAVYIIYPDMMAELSTQHYLDLMTISGLPGDPVHQLFVSLAKKYLNDPESVDWATDIPNAEKVSEERTQEISSLLKADDIAAAQSLMMSASMDERLALVKLAAEDEEIIANQSLWQAQTPERLKIRNLFDENSAAPSFFGDLEMGPSLTLDLINQWLKKAQEMALSGENGQVSIQVMGYHHGVALNHQVEMLNLNKKGIRLNGINRQTRINSEFALDTPLKLSPPADGEKKKLSILDLVEGKQDQQLETLSADIYLWLTAPLPPNQASGTLTITYCGTPPEE